MPEKVEKLTMNPIEKARVEFRHPGRNLTFTTVSAMAWTVLLLFSLMGCKPGKTKIDGVKYFGPPTSVLKYVRGEWVERSAIHEFSTKQISRRFL